MTPSPEPDVSGRAAASSDPDGSGSEPRATLARLPLPRALKWFVVLFAFDLVVRSVLGVSVGKKWSEQLHMRGLPLGLPTQSELRKIAQEDSKYESALERYAASAWAVARFFNPLPSEKTLAELGTAEQWGKYTLVWLDTRLRFVGRLTGTNHSWPMFSPSTRRARAVVRGKLIYEDGTTRTLLSLVEPKSFTDYSRWLIKRPQKNDERLDTHYSARMGKCNYWSRRFARAPSGSKLVTIELYKLNYRFPPPGKDVRAHWKKARAKAKPKLFWTYDVRKRKGKEVKEPEVTAEATPTEQQPEALPSVDEAPQPLASETAPADAPPEGEQPSAPAASVEGAEVP